MQIISISKLIAVIAVLSSISACVSNSQTLISSGGDIKTCASTSQAQGIIGVFLANSRFSNCIDDLKNHGYKEIEQVGSVGITLYTADTKGLRIMKVYENSPAAKAGIVQGDIIIAINEKKTLQKGDLDIVQGEIGTSVSITISRNGVENKYTLKRSKFYYSKALEDITYE